MEDKKIENILKNKNREELLDLLLRISERDSNVGRLILEDDKWERGTIDELTASISEEIAALASERAWSNHWSDEGYIPNYSNVSEQFAILLAGGYADEVVALGEELVDLTHDQLEESCDEGELSCELSYCMDVVIEALRKSSKSGTEQILWIIDIEKSDNYGIFGSGVKLLEENDYTEGDWKGVAEFYEALLSSPEYPDRASAVLWLIRAYEHSKRNDLVIPLLEREVEKTLLYVNLVDRLLQRGDLELARNYAIRGCERERDKNRHTLNELKKRLLQIALSQGRFAIGVSYIAESFMEHPSLERYLELLDTARKAELFDETRIAALHYLETGDRKAWSLPATDISHLRLVENARCGFPNYVIMIEAAIHEKRHDDIIDLYGKYKYRRGPVNPMERWFSPTALDEEVADALVDSYPDISLDIWRTLVESLIALVKPEAYKRAAPFLRNIRKTLEKCQLEDDWGRYLSNLRVKHKAKRRLMEILKEL